MITNVAVSEKYNIVMVFDTPPDTDPPPELSVRTIDIPPDNIKELVDRYIGLGYNVIVTPAVVRKCGLRETDFEHRAKEGVSTTKTGSVDEITSLLINLERRRLENEQ